MRPYKSSDLGQSCSFKILKTGQFFLYGGSIFVKVEHHRATPVFDVLLERPVESSPRPFQPEHEVYPIGVDFYITETQTYIGRIE